MASRRSRVRTPSAPPNTILFPDCKNYFSPACTYGLLFPTSTKIPEGKWVSSTQLVISAGTENFNLTKKSSTIQFGNGLTSIWNAPRDLRRRSLPITESRLRQFHGSKTMHRNRLRA